MISPQKTKCSQSPGCQKIGTQILQKNEKERIQKHEDKQEITCAASCCGHDVLSERHGFRFLEPVPEGQQQQRLDRQQQRTHHFCRTGFHCQPDDCTDLDRRQRSARCGQHPRHRGQHGLCTLQRRWPRLQQRRRPRFRDLAGQQPERALEHQGQRRSEYGRRLPAWHPVL